VLLKEEISKIDNQFSICKLCYVCLKNNKMPKLALANGLWIAITPMVLSKLTMVEETLITHYCKLRYNNRGNTTWQHALKGIIVSFAQDPESAMNF
jgi:hypothetical protein